jgi:hypothetical protein
MLKKEAYEKLTNALRECSDKQFADVKTLMVDGAGCLGLPEGMQITEPQSVAQDRRDVLISLVDAVQDCTDSDDFPLPRSGGWEYVIATLVIEQDWEKAHEVAEQIRAEKAEASHG